MSEDIVADWKTKQREILALLYRDNEYNVLPSIGKAPCVPWKRWRTERVPVELLCEWSQRKFQKEDGTYWSLGRETVLNWALPTGLKPYSDSPGLIVVDSDGPEAEEVVDDHCPPTGWCQKTGGGGYHRVYRRPPEDKFPNIPNRVKTTLGGKTYGIDIRGDGGIIMCPGSRHKSGNFYEWERPWETWIMRYPQWMPFYNPDWLPHEGDERTASSRRLGMAVEDLAEHAEAVGQPGLFPLQLRMAKARAYLEGCPGSTQGLGKGADNYCYALAMKICWGFALPATEAVEVLLEWGEKDGNRDAGGHYYPWEESQIRHKVDNAVCAAYDGVVGDALEGAAHDMQRKILKMYALI